MVRVRVAPQRKLFDEMPWIASSTVQHPSTYMSLVGVDLLSGRSIELTVLCTASCNRAYTWRRCGELRPPAPADTVQPASDHAPISSYSPG